MTIRVGMKSAWVSSEFCSVWVSSYCGYHGLRYKI
nr:MAG TPA: hypothetical protein [Caudoviricetes sp.]DAT11954.1 MAG TPA: hypothetical protein [Bacteriophage sp.]